MGKGTVSDELIDFFQMDAERIPTQSALIQRRNQLSEYAFQYLFHESSARFNPAEKREEKDPDLVVESQKSS